jgi:hypothetical protein
MKVGVAGLLANAAGGQLLKEHRFDLLHVALHMTTSPCLSVAWSLVGISCIADGLPYFDHSA